MKVPMSQIVIIETSTPKIKIAPDNARLMAKRRGVTLLANRTALCPSVSDTPARKRISRVSRFAPPVFGTDLKALESNSNAPLANPRRDAMKWKNVVVSIVYMLDLKVQALGSAEVRIQLPLIPSKEPCRVGGLSLLEYWQALCL